jgi:hypothetical protein
MPDPRAEEEKAEDSFDKLRRVKKVKIIWQGRDARSGRVFATHWKDD